MLASRPIKYRLINSSIGELGSKMTFLIIGKLLMSKLCNLIKINWVFFIKKKSEKVGRKQAEINQMSWRNIYFPKDANENLNIDIILPGEAEVKKCAGCFICVLYPYVFIFLS